MLRPISCLACALLLSTAIGCSEKLPTVSGLVTIDGKPVPEGMISFQPVTGGAIAVARINPDGSYAVKTGTEAGLKPGEYKIAISAPKGIIPAPTPENPNPKIDRWVPLKYNDIEMSGLSINVTSGSTTHDLELKSK
jgi:hypothetical protein